MGLVLGAGGVVGAAWLIGALEALATETGWDPSSADFVVGTSAGSVVGALVADGIAPEYLAAYSSGRTLDEVDDVDGRVARLAARVGGPEKLDEVAERMTGDALRLQLAPPPIGPGSWRLAINTLRHPRRHAPSAMLAGWLPRGFVSTRPISDLVETFVAGEWPDHPNYWAIAADYRTGERVAFGREDAPRASVGPAVASSCAIPGFYHPVAVDGRRYVDGGVCSMSNLDLLAGRDLDLVICLNPTSSLAELAGGTPAERVGGLVRGLSGRRLGREARKLRAEGTELLLVQPSEEDVVGMGLNLMARGRRVEVMERARKTTALALRELRGSGRLMPERNRRRGTAAPRARQRAAGGSRRGRGGGGAAGRRAA
ncbi:MAG TPA: patatin-like phospholipase family protein [Baekduia sp.]|uniref:patatin-like phospholipase family protein n=1 Tax=Baekduia sp. TaxID=2600305 RepID=UPI002D783820|nr:patatin-like phospholipase family protein [Baekduia sp.]HET6505842.1 patatin-like phospholipase family protein [Baekduia sp.]